MTSANADLKAPISPITIGFVSVPSMPKFSMYWGSVRSRPGYAWMSAKSATESWIAARVRMMRGSPRRLGFGSCGSKKPTVTSAVGSTARIADRTRLIQYRRLSSSSWFFCAWLERSYVLPLGIGARPEVSVNGLLWLSKLSSLRNS